MNENTIEKEKIAIVLNEQGVSPEQAIEMIAKELQGDGLIYYDLGSYTTVEMLPEADYVMQKCLGKNLINHHEYHKTTKIHQKLVHMIGNLLNSPKLDEPFGSSTTGSSEAIFLSILAAKWQWKKKGLQGNPNIVFCNNAHISWYKFSKFLEIDIREVPLEETHDFPLDNVLEQVNQNTIMVVAVLGCTQLGSCDPISLLNEALETINLENNWDVGIHVDAAIGGFIIPFQEEERNWDFKLSLVRSINLSGHKYGLVYPGLGWLLFRNESFFPHELNVTSHYLSGSSDSFTVSFSRSASHVMAQYFNFLHYGINGYRKVIRKCMHLTEKLTDLLVESDLFEICSDGSLPMIVFSLKDTVSFDEYVFTGKLREKNWMLPCYPLSQNGKTVMRIVIRNEMTIPMIRLLASDLIHAYNELTTPSDDDQ